MSSSHAAPVPRLAAGARVALISPAGPLRGAADLERAVANARSFGWNAVPGRHVLAREGYFAGRDADRLADLDWAVADDTIDGIWCIRGGYGAMRLLEHCDLARLRQHPKPILGYSDITAIHLAVSVCAGLVSFHAPTARATLTEFSRASLERAVVRGDDPCGNAPEAQTVRSGVATGWLAGGNLALLAALAGTPYAPRFDGAIVVLEDINEAVYRIDRMLQQLRLAGIFRGCRAVAFGKFEQCPEESDDGARRLDDVVAELAEHLDVPCVSGIPLGHIDDQWTIPLGAEAELDADARRLTVRPGFTQ